MVLEETRVTTLVDVLGASWGISRPNLWILLYPASNKNREQLLNSRPQGQHKEIGFCKTRPITIVAFLSMIWKRMTLYIVV